MVVVDTNILACLLIKGDRTADAQALFTRDAEWRSEGVVLATYQRSGALNRSAAEAMLATAERVVSGLVNLPHGRALKLAGDFGVSAYDARFLGAAQHLGSRLVTEDARLRAAAPTLTRSLAEVLAA
jgi:predicted nucleic acid-binding protein